MLVIPNRLVRNVYNQKLCYDQLPVGLIRALPGYLRSQGSNPGKLEFCQPFFHNYIIYWSKHVSCVLSCDDLLCIYSKSLLLVCNPNHYFRCLTLTWPLTWHCDSFTHLALVVQTLDSAIHRINHYPAAKYYGNQLRYPLDSDLSGG